MIKKIITKFSNIPKFSFLKKEKKDNGLKKDIFKKVDYKAIIEKQKKDF